MRRNTWTSAILVFVVLFVAGGLGLIRARAQDEAVKRSDVMRRKLDLSKKVLEGLTREDYGLMTDGATSLRELSEASAWKMGTIPNAEEYLALTQEFKRLCDDLSKKSQAKNIDGATLAYVQLTMNCVKCHKYVRSVTK